MGGGKRKRREVYRRTRRERQVAVIVSSGTGFIKIGRGERDGGTIGDRGGRKRREEEENKHDTSDPLIRDEYGTRGVPRALTKAGLIELILY